MRISAIEATPFKVLPFSVSSSANSARGDLPFFRAVVDELPDSLDAVIATGDLQGFAGEGARLMELGEATALEIARMQRDGQLPAPGRTGVVLTGDLHAGADEADVLPVWRAFGAISRWVAGVAGNHDHLGPSPPRDFNSHLVDGSTVTVDGIRVGGICGIVSSKDGLWHRNERDYTTVLSSLMEEHCDLVVLHDGPNVAGTGFPGWPSIRQVLESATPVLLIRGHDHWLNPVAELANGTQVVNVEGRVVVLLRLSGGTAGGT
jgi:Icc protein